MNSDDNKTDGHELPDDDHSVFIPDGDMWAIERVIRNMEQAQQEFHKVQEGIRTMES
jgi:hypothetical protein